MRSASKLFVITVTFIAAACGSSARKSDRATAAATLQASSHPASTNPAAAERIDLLTRALGAVRRPAHYWLDERSITGDSALKVVREGEVVNVEVFTGAPRALATVHMSGPRRAGDPSCYGAFDQSGMPLSSSQEGHEDAMVLFMGSCNRKGPADPTATYRLGRGALLTEAQIRARLAQHTPIFLIDDTLATKSEALGLLGQHATTGRRAYTIATYFADDAAHGGIVVLGTRMPVLNP